MHISRQHACYLIAILFLCCLIQSEKEWIKSLTDWQSESFTEAAESLLAQYQRQTESVWEELIYFPVPDSTLSAKVSVSFKNTWQAERNYGGRRKHEGIDLIADPDKSGYFPIVSMTDGTVEQVGWLEKGGWRIGIRSAGGNYYYYAHFHSYIKEWKSGDPVKAGEVLGYMGDTGYGPEGTTGQFPVHLHVGIYLPSEEGGEMAVNPYWMLRYLESWKLTYSY